MQSLSPGDMLVLRSCNALSTDLVKVRFEHGVTGLYNEAADLVNSKRRALRLMWVAPIPVALFAGIFFVSYVGGVHPRMNMFLLGLGLAVVSVGAFVVGAVRRLFAAVEINEYMLRPGRIGYDYPMLAEMLGWGVGELRCKAESELKARAVEKMRKRCQWLEQSEKEYRDTPSATTIKDVCQHLEAACADFELCVRFKLLEQPELGLDQYFTKKPTLVAHTA